MDLMTLCVLAGGFAITGVFCQKPSNFSSQEPYLDENELFTDKTVHLLCPNNYIAQGQAI